MSNDDLAMQSTAGFISIEAKFVAVFAAALLCFAWWLFLYDREPTSKEMTLAYRKHFVPLKADNDPQALNQLRARLKAIKLEKQQCGKLESKRYHCTAVVLTGGQLVHDNQLGGNAIYSRDAKGWQFDPID